MPGASLPPPWRTRWRVRIGYPVGLACILLAQPSTTTMCAGAVLSIAGLAIRAAAAGHLRKHEVLAIAGPYAWTRNPLYLGSLLLGAGFLLAAASWIGAILAAAYVCVFYPGVMRREEEELRSEYGSAFDEYARQVPLFWPRSPRGTASEPFMWALYRKNREYQAVAGAAVAFAMLAAEMYWRAR